MTIPVLYEDNHLLVVRKPCNLPTQADSSGDADLLTLCKQYIGEKYHKPGAVYLGLVHRLDRPVAGVVLLARTSKAAARMSAQLKDGRMKRRYIAVVEGDVPEEGELRHHLRKDARANTTSAVPEGTPGAKLALLTYRRLGMEGGLSLAAIQLQTGRSHQIRVQFAAQGHPLWGDNRYGNGRPGQQIALFAKALFCRHPVTGESLAFELDAPREDPWTRFSMDNPLFQTEANAL